MKTCPVDPAAPRRAGFPVRLLAGLLLALSLTAGFAQADGPRIAAIQISFVGPATVSEDLIRANIRSRAGEVFFPAVVDDDIKNLYATGLFYNIRVTRTDGENGITLGYVVQPKPRLTDIRFTGNRRFSSSRLTKKLSVKVGEPLNEQKLFTDAQEIEKLYQKSGYPGTRVKYVLAIEEATGRGTVTFEVAETRKVRIERVDFVGATAFTQKQLRKTIKTRDRWMFSWLTGSGVFKEEVFEEDREKLAEFYRNRGYIDFEITDVKLVDAGPRRIIVEIHVNEGTPYQVGSVTFDGVTLLPTNAVRPDFQPGPRPPKGPERDAWQEQIRLNRQFSMKEGDTFTPRGQAANNQAIEDFYGARGHIDVTPSSGNLRVSRVANVERGTLDLEYRVNEGQPSYIEKIEIRGNTKTKDRVIRRELAVAPGELFDSVRVKISQQRLQGLQYFDKVDARPEATDIPNRKNLVISVEEKNTGNISLGAGFSTVDSVVGYVQFTQGNFDLGNPPWFTGGGQKLRVRMQIGSKRQDYTIGFIEPWFLDRKLALSVDLFHRELSYQSYGSLYDESHTGAKLGLTRALGSDFLIGTVSYMIERVDIYDVSTNAPTTIQNQEGAALFHRFGATLAYDTRNSTMLPDGGQRTELIGQLNLGDYDFYNLELKSSWYFKGLAKGHVLELVGRVGVAEALSGGDTIPFYERYYLGGLYSMRGYKYRAIGPREPWLDGSGRTEPIGGNTYWFGTAEYSIPIIERLRFALFYDIGNVLSDSYDFNFSDYADNWGVGLRLNLPIGPLRLDYGVPISHPDYVGGGGRFQFGVGYTRDF
ncbi:MAG: outer membrane protein assembly factor BamA [Limisphaerales bacterium]